jgi:hypothetical protein
MSIKINIPEGYEVDKEKSTFEKIIFKKIKAELPKTWEEFCAQNPNTKDEYYIDVYSNIQCYKHPDSYRMSDNDKSLLSTKEDAEAHLALIQLHRLRDIYRQGWKPNWNDKNDKYCINYVEGIIRIYALWYSQCFLSFQSKEIAEQFIENFKDLIEQARDLI